MAKVSLLVDSSQCLHSKLPRQTTVYRGKQSISRKGSLSTSLLLVARYLTPASSCSFSSSALSLFLYAIIAGPSDGITESRLNDAAFWRGGYLTKFSI